MMKLIKWDRPEMINSMWTNVEWYTKDDGTIMEVLSNDKFGQIHIARNLLFIHFTQI